MTIIHENLQVLYHKDTKTCRFIKLICDIFYYITIFCSLIKERLIRIDLARTAAPFGGRGLYSLLSLSVPIVFLPPYTLKRKMALTRAYW